MLSIRLLLPFFSGIGKHITVVIPQNVAYFVGF